MPDRPRDDADLDRLYAITRKDRPERWRPSIADVIRKHRREVVAGGPLMAFLQQRVSYADELRVESFVNGVATIGVASAATRYLFEGDLRCGLFAEAIQHCNAELKRVRVVASRRSLDDTP